MIKCSSCDREVPAAFEIRLKVEAGYDDDEVYLCDACMSTPLGTVQTWMAERFANYIQQTAEGIFKLKPKEEVEITLTEREEAFARRVAEVAVAALQERADRVLEQLRVLQRTTDLPTDGDLVEPKE